MKQNYAYHYSATEFKSLKTYNMLSGEEDISMGENKVSMFLAPIESKHFTSLKNNGFVPYADKKIFYEHKINILDNALAFDNDIYITSSPEQIKYDEKHWDSFWDKNDGIENKTSEEFSILRNEYGKLWMKEYYKIYKSLTPYKYPSNDRVFGLIFYYERYIKYNIKHGNKNQYASYIPHIHTVINKPLIVESIKKIRF